MTTELKTVTVGNKMTLKDGSMFVPLEIFGKLVFGRVSSDNKSWSALALDKSSDLFAEKALPVGKVTPATGKLGSVGDSDGHAGYSGGY